MLSRVRFNNPHGPEEYVNYLLQDFEFLYEERILLENFAFLGFEKEFLHLMKDGVDRLIQRTVDEIEIFDLYMLKEECERRIRIEELHEMVN